MKIKTLLSTLFISMILTAGCAGKASDIVDETNKKDTTKTVQGDTAGAKTTDNGTVAKDDNTLNGQNQDQNVQDMTSAENSVKSVYFDYDKCKSISKIMRLFLTMILTKSFMLKSKVTVMSGVVMSTTTHLV